MKSLIKLNFLIFSFCCTSAIMIAQKSTLNVGFGIGNTSFIYGHVPNYRIGYERELFEQLSLSCAANFMKVGLGRDSQLNEAGLFETEALKTLDLGLVYYCFDKKQKFNIGTWTMRLKFGTERTTM